MTVTLEKPGAPPASVAAAVFVPSSEMPKGSQKVKELDFNNFSDTNISAVELVAGMSNMGIQASTIGEATRIIDSMVCYLPTSLLLPLSQ
jgi:deoxyhypusine synthase